MSKFVVVDGVLYRRNSSGFTKVLKDLSELYTILDYYQDKSGHFAVKSLFDILSKVYYRPRLYEEIKGYVDSCQVCQEYSLKRPSYKFSGESAISGSLMEWMLDYLGPFPVSISGNRHLFVAINVLTCYPLVLPVLDVTAETSMAAIKKLISTLGFAKS